MSSHPAHKLGAVVAVSAALWLSACGGSSKTGTESASSNAGATRQQSSVATQSKPTSAATRTTSSAAQSTTSTSSATTTTTAAPSSEERKRWAAQRTAIATVSKCLRAHGVKVPPQHLSGPNPTFNSEGVNVSSPLFKQCYKKALAAYNGK